MSGKLFFFSFLLCWLTTTFFKITERIFIALGQGMREMNKKGEKVQSVPEIPSKQRPCLYLPHRGSLCTDSQQAKKAVYMWVRTPTLGKSFLFSDSISSMAK